MKIIAFAASNSRQSINKQLVIHAGETLKADINSNAEIEILDLNDYEMPLFSVDREAADGIPQAAQDFLDKIESAEALLISFAEHNGSYTVAYKNIFDWASRIEPKVYQNKPGIVLSTSPGGRGGASVMQTITNVAPHQGLEIKGSFSIGRFYDVFKNGRLTDEAIDQQLQDTLKQLF